MRRFITAVLVVAATVVTPTTALAAPAVSTVYVSDRGGQTSFATVAGERYLITVSGAFEGSRADLHPLTGDCGWWFLDIARQTAERHDLVTVDGHPAACQNMPPSETHTYQWTEIGTGAPFSFDLGWWVLAGGLTFTVTGARANVAHDVTGYCHLRPFTSPLLDYIPLIIEAGAEATTSAPAMSTSISCDVTSGRGESVYIRQGLPGPFVKAVDRMTVPAGDSLYVCSSAWATWDDGVEKATTMACYVLEF